MPKNYTSTEDTEMIFYHHKKTFKPEELKYLSRDPREKRCICKRCYRIEMTEREFKMLTAGEK